MSTYDVCCEEQYVAQEEAVTEGALHRLVSAAGALLAVWAARTSQRNQLGRLNDHLLKDIGITRAEVRVEARKPFWVE